MESKYTEARMAMANKDWEWRVDGKEYKKSNNEEIYKKKKGED